MPTNGAWYRSGKVEASFGAFRFAATLGRVTCHVIAWLRLVLGLDIERECIAVNARTQAGRIAVLLFYILKPGG